MKLALTETSILFLGNQIILTKINVWAWFLLYNSLPLAWYWADPQENYGPKIEYFCICLNYESNLGIKYKVDKSL